MGGLLLCMIRTSHVVQCSGPETETPPATGDMLERNAEIRALIEAGELVGYCAHPRLCLESAYSQGAGVVQVPDTLVGDALLDIILDPQESDGSGLLIGGCLTGAARQGRGCAWQHTCSSNKC